MPQNQKRLQPPDFEVAVRALAELNSRYDESRIDDLCEAEEAILSHTPRTVRDVGDMLDVLLTQSAERSDGLDKEAIRAIRTFMRQLESNGHPPPA